MALSAVGRNAIREKRATPAGACKRVAAVRPALNQPSPDNVASSMLPKPIAAEVASEPAVVSLAANAATRIAGATRYPRSSTAASANPVGGQIGVALGLIEATSRPSFASAK